MPEVYRETKQLWEVISLQVEIWEHVGTDFVPVDQVLSVSVDSVVYVIKVLGTQDLCHKI